MSFNPTFRISSCCSGAEVTRCARIAICVVDSSSEEMLEVAPCRLDIAADLNDVVEAGDGRDGTNSELRAPLRFPSSSCNLSVSILRDMQYSTTES